MHKNQRGFSVVEGFLILVIVGSIGFVGWYVWNSNRNTNQLLTNANKTSNNAPVTAKVPSGWTQFKDKTTGLSFSYPKNWTLENGLKFDSSLKEYDLNDLMSADKATTVAFILTRAKDGRNISTSIDNWKATAAKGNISYTDLTEVKSQYKSFEYVLNANGATALSYVVLAPGNQLDMTVLPTITNQKTIIDQIVNTVHFE